MSDSCIDHECNAVDYRTGALMIVVQMIAITVCWKIVYEMCWRLGAIVSEWAHKNDETTLFVIVHDNIVGVETNTTLCNMTQRQMRFYAIYFHSAKQLRNILMPDISKKEYTIPLSCILFNCTVGEMCCDGWLNAKKMSCAYDRVCFVANAQNIERAYKMGADTAAHMRLSHAPAPTMHLINTNVVSHRIQ